MHIIFGKEQADELSNRYTMLELDTVSFGSNTPPVTAYCAVEKISFDQLTNLNQLVRQHQDLMLNYRMRRWSECQEAIQQLTGKWGGELDSFYENLRDRIDSYMQEDPGPNWTPEIIKTIT